MMWWHGKHLTGDPRRIIVQPQNEQEATDVAMLLPPKGFHVQVRRDDGDWVRYVIEVVPDEQTKAEADDSGERFDEMEIDELRTIAAERGVKIDKRDGKPVIIQKLNQAA